MRFRTNNVFVGVFAEAYVGSVGVNVALKTCLLDTAGSQLHVAVKFGYEPEVGTERQFAILFPSMKNRTRPEVLTDTERRVTTPLYAVPEIESEPIDVVVSGVYRIITIPDPPFPPAPWVFAFPEI